MRSRAFYLTLSLVFTAGLGLTGLILSHSAITPQAEAQDRNENAAWLGVALQDLNTELREAMDIERRVRGAVVTRVVPDSPADRAGFEEGDVITEIDNRRTGSADEIIEAVRSHEPGDEILIVVNRDGRNRGLKTELGSRHDDGEFRWYSADPDEKVDREVRRHLARKRKGRAPRVYVHDDDGKTIVVAPEDDRADRVRDRIKRRFRLAPRHEVMVHDEGGYLGVMTMNLGEQLADYFGVEDGALITEVVEGSPAESAGLRAGDVILTVDDDDIDGPRDLRRAVRDHEPDSEVVVTVMRNGNRHDIRVQLGSAGDLGSLEIHGEHRTIVDLEDHLHELGEGNVFVLPDLEHLKELEELEQLEGLKALEDLHINLEGLKHLEGLEALENFHFDLEDLPEIEIHLDKNDFKDLHKDLRKHLRELRRQLEDVKEIRLHEQSKARDAYEKALEKAQAERREAAREIEAREKEARRLMREARRLGPGGSVQLVGTHNVI